MQQMLGEMVHPSWLWAAQHNAAFEEKKWWSWGLVNLMSFDASVGEHIGDIDIVPLGLFGRDIQSWNVVEVLLHFQLSVTLVASHRNAVNWRP